MNNENETNFLEEVIKNLPFQLRKNIKKGKIKDIRQLCQVVDQKLIRRQEYKKKIQKYKY